MTIDKPTKHKSLDKVISEVWPVFSLFTRLRDSIRTTGTTEHCCCISCGDVHPLTMTDAGHLVNRWYKATLFDERNVHGQCKRCNRMHETLRYRRAVVTLYGEGIDVQLEEIATNGKKWSRTELKGLKRYYREEIKKLKAGDYTALQRHRV